MHGSFVVQVDTSQSGVLTFDDFLALLSPNSPSDENDLVSHPSPLLPPSLNRPSPKFHTWRSRSSMADFPLDVSLCLPLLRFGPILQRVAFNVFDVDRCGVINAKDLA